MTASRDSSRMIYDRAGDTGQTWEGKTEGIKTDLGRVHSEGINSGRCRSLCFFVA